MDPDLERYLNERGIPERALELCGAVCKDGVLRWPRYGNHGGRLLGWKCRDLDTGRFWGDPAGISHGDTEPLVIRNQMSASGAMICEGESDTMRLACTNLPTTYASDVVCIPGANAFPAEWVQMLRGYQYVHVFADADEAGAALPNRLSQLVPGVRVVRLPRGRDVCSFLLEHTEADLVRLYDIAPLHVAPDPGPLRRQAFSWDDAGARDHRDKLVRIILQDGVELRRRGHTEYVASCPFHDEQTPSFSVNPDRGLYRCFGCGAAGDVISYLKSKRGMSFKEAMRYLEEFR